MNHEKLLDLLDRYVETKIWNKISINEGIDESVDTERKARKELLEFLKEELK